LEPRRSPSDQHALAKSAVPVELYLTAMAFGGVRSPRVNLEQWQQVIGREIEQLSRAPFFVLNPGALVAVRDELHVIQNGCGRDHELEQDDDTWAVVDNAWRLHAKVREADRELGRRGRAELELFTAERLVEASLRYR
jgi:hypothetical protein